jgi:ceramide glucosyltransferase
MIGPIAGMTAVLAGIGLAQAMVASRLVMSFARAPVNEPDARPPVTVLKPLHGGEPLLEAALTTLCRQVYPERQLVFGVSDESDAATEVVRRLRERFPDFDITLVVDPARHGVNPKIDNLINMMPAARHDVLVIADSDVHVHPDYLERLVAALEQPGVGLATTLYAGLPLHPVKLPGRLGAMQITSCFLPGALLSRAIGRQDCLGATMCLHRKDLERIGGFHALVDHLADDNVLGRRIAGLGLRVVLAQTVPLTTVPETGFRALFQHELRWARTIRALEPIGFAASIVQYPLAWCMLTIALAGGALWSIALFMVVWVLRALAALAVDRALASLWGRQRTVGRERCNDEAALAFLCPVWLLPLRDIMSVTVMLASYGGRHVIWRGYGLEADTPPPIEEIKAR